MKWNNFEDLLRTSPNISAHIKTVLKQKMAAWALNKHKLILSLQFWRPLPAVSPAFMFFHVLHLLQPTESRKVWLFFIYTCQFLSLLWLRTKTRTEQSDPAETEVKQVFGGLGRTIQIQVLDPVKTLMTLRPSLSSSTSYIRMWWWSPGRLSSRCSWGSTVK